MSGYGSIYTISWWGDVNAPNGWGSIYPTDADGSLLTADTTLLTADNTTIKADATQF
jgi:hypothetical protein